MPRGFARGGVGDRRFGFRNRHYGEPLFVEEAVADTALAAIEEAPFGDDFRHPGMGRPGMGGMGGRGMMGGGATQGVSQAIQQLKQAVDAAGRGGSLVALQAAFDNLRNAMKSAFPSGGPNGAVG